MNSIWRDARMGLHKPKFILPAENRKQLLKEMPKIGISLSPKFVSIINNKLKKNLIDKNNITLKTSLGDNYFLLHGFQHDSDFRTLWAVIIKNENSKLSILFGSILGITNSIEGIEKAVYQIHSSYKWDPALKNSYEKCFINLCKEHNCIICSDSDMTVSAYAAWKSLLEKINKSYPDIRVIIIDSKTNKEIEFKSIENIFGTQDAHRQWLIGIMKK